MLVLRQTIAENARIKQKACTNRYLARLQAVLTCRGVHNAVVLRRTKKNAPGNFETGSSWRWLLHMQFGLLIFADVALVVVQGRGLQNLQFFRREEFS